MDDTCAGAQSQALDNAWVPPGSSPAARIRDKLVRVGIRVTTVFIVFAALLAALVLFVRWVEPRVAFFPFPGETTTPREFGVSYEPLTIETADGERLRAWMMRASGSRGLIVYFHGNGGNLSNWAPILAGIVGRGYSLLAVDYRGYGVSTGRPSERGLYRDVDAVITVAQRERQPGVPLIYWGRSLGASMAAYAASTSPPDGVILEAGFPDARAAMRGSGVMSVLALASSYEFPAARFMQAVRVPALVIHGDRDSVIPFALGRELYEGLSGPKAFVVVRGGDHNDATPADADYWPAVDRFITARR